MFCPQCQAEYRQGFTRCADCDVDLVYELPLQASQDRAAGHGISDGYSRVLWKCDSERECVAVCRDLLRAGIEYQVAQIPEPADRDGVAKKRYEISVASSDYELAKQAARIDDTPSDSVNPPEGEITNVELAADDSPTDEPVRNNAYLKPWYSEGATVEVWSGSSSDGYNPEFALKENLIHFRSDLQDGKRKVYVMPEDEARAREIIRQIAENTPLK